MNAREFIIQNSTKFQQAVENGLDIRMEESEILEWMERYRAAAPKTVQLCPKCFGEATIQNAGHAITSSLFRTCPVCNGSRYFIV